MSAYECGFEAFSDARGKFDVRYYLVALLFIIFDLEVAYLFPWAVSLGAIGLFGFGSMMAFIGLLGRWLRLRVEERGHRVGIINPFQMQKAEAAAKLLGEEVQDKGFILTKYEDLLAWGAHRFDVADDVWLGLLWR